jgi:hypothetical protein
LAAAGPLDYTAPEEESMKLWTLIGALLLSITAYSQDSFSVATQRISNTAVFAFGGVGYAGQTSEGEASYMVLMSQPRATALAALETLYTMGNSQARGYALAGIRKLDSTKFNELRLSLRSSDEKVQTMWGCVIEEKLLRKVADDLSSGKYDPFMRSSCSWCMVANPHLTPLRSLLLPDCR